MATIRLSRMIALVRIIFLIGAGAAVYVPGQPGGAWSKNELLIVKSKLFKLYQTNRSAPKAVRLAFHDCLKYADSSGGCDGCLNWSGVDVKFTAVKFARNESNVEETNNNGLGGFVRSLERVYREEDYPSNTPELVQSLYESGKSRADLWAYAGIVGVEFGMDMTNVACEDWTDKRVLTRSCIHDTGPACKIIPERPFKFQYGRSDCINHDSIDSYKTKDIENHPSPIANGRTTVEFFKDDFGFNGRETVAIFGAHTFGKPHIDVSLFPYTWTSSGTHIFNNDYYKGITGQPRWFFKDDNCTPLGDAFGNKPQSRWLAHTRKITSRGGPVFWIHQNLVCPSKFNEDLSASGQACLDEAEPGMTCKADPTTGSNTPRSPGQMDGDVNSGCERFRLISGRDEIALNCEMGLYREFEMDDGVIHGCRGLEHFNSSMADPNPTKATWSSLPGVGRAQPECPKQRLAEPLGSTPLYEIMEEYADDQTAWINDFIPTMEKMMRNGYPAGLTDAPNHHQNVKCDLPAKGYYPFCYEVSPASDMEPFMVGSRYSELAGKVYQYNPVSQLFDFGDMTGESNQLWRISESGDQAINALTNEPLIVRTSVAWRFEKDGDDFVLVDPLTTRVVDCR